MRGIDHLVLPVSDLDAAAETFSRLGFRTTPPAAHPFGTGNFLVQMDHCFLELLAVVDRSKIPQEGDQLAFADRVDGFLDRYGDGFGWLVLDSSDAASDRAEYLSAGIKVMAPFGFERIAKQPDGSEKKVAFSLTIVADPEAPDLGYFTCQNHYPENFWKPEYQSHPNGASVLKSVFFVCDDPNTHAGFFRAFTGADGIQDGPDRLHLPLSRGSVDLLSKSAFEDRFGYVPLDRSGSERMPRLAGYEISVGDLDATRVGLEANGVQCDSIDRRLAVSPDTAHGSLLLFSAD